MAKVSKQEREEAIKELRELLKPGTTVYCILKHVSRSGMTRHISLILVRHDGILHLTSLASKALGWPVTSSGDYALKVSGAGMDMGFHTVYTLSKVLFPEGYEGRDGGYALKHEWL